MFKKNQIIIFNKFTRLPAYCILLWGAAGILSCNKNSVDNRQITGKMVVLTEITAGDTANIPIGSTLPAGNGDAIVFEKLNTVVANIYGQDGSAESLFLNNSPDFSSNPMAVYSGAMTLKYNTTYTLSATEPQLGTIAATTTIPNNFSVQQTETEMDDLNGKSVLRFGFNIHDAGGEKNYYIFEAVKQLVNISRYFYWQGIKYDYNLQQGYDLYQQVKNNTGVVLLRDTVLTHHYIRLNTNTKDNNTSNANMSSLDSPFRRIFITDSLFNGRDYESEIWIAIDHFIAADPQETGIVQVQVKSVSKELYDYLFQYEKYNQDFRYFSVSNLTSPVENVQNSFKVFSVPSGNSDLTILINYNTNCSAKNGRIRPPGMSDLTPDTPCLHRRFDA